MVMTARPQITPVRTLPGRYYYDPAIFSQEQELLFGQSWVCAGLAAQLPEPGSYFLATVGGENVIVLRDRVGQVRAFLNVCTHRGARVCVAAQGQLRATMQCGYHAWTFALDGRLIGAPNMKDEPDFDPARYGLAPVALEVWEGLVWLNLASERETLADQLGDYYTRYARYHAGELAIGATITYDVQANWKLLVENFNECCHCAIAHPELSAQVPSFKAGLVSGYSGGGARLGDGVESLTVTGKTTRPALRDLTADDKHTYYGMTFKPNVFFSLHPDYVLVHVMQPQGPDRTIVRCDWLFEKETIARSDFDPADAVSMWDTVNRQDWEICQLTQQGVTSRVYRHGGLYAPLERHIREFNDYVLDRLGHVASEA